MSHSAARVALLWHMHQPYYRDLETGRSILPWVRLHAVKDYYPMAKIAAGYPEVHMTFNLVPSLLKQIEEYATDGLRDDFWDRTVIPAADLNADDRRFLLRNFFMANWDLAIKPNRRYGELLEKRGYQPTDRELDRAASLFSVQDLLDLQIWMNLVWFHPLSFEEDAGLAAIRKRGRSFSEEDKNYVLERQLGILRGVIPLYRELLDRGQIEISTSPFYHPILPLLVNMQSALEAMPGLPLPWPPFARPEDAALQLARAVEYHTRVFGRAPEGLWPSEGSVSEELIPLVMDAGFSWMATDEDILYRSLGLAGQAVTDEVRCALLYRGHRLERHERQLNIIFRDHFLSDAIGFTYGRWDPGDAAADLLSKLTGIGERCMGNAGAPIISLILDGENPWEYYRGEGYLFLKRLYEGLARSAKLQSATVAGGLRDTERGQNIPRLFAGSWINHDFRIWIGHPDDRRAWELLINAHKVLDEVAGDGERERRAREEMLIAEGSDWCWWYGDENSSGNDEAFDQLYRAHLKNVYTLAGRAVPDELRVTILTGKKEMVPVIKVYSFINPTIDGRVTSYFEWLAAGEYPISQRGTTMHQVGAPLAAIHFGFNPSTLFLRLDPAMQLLVGDLTSLTFAVHFLKPSKVRFDVRVDAQGTATLTAMRDEGVPSPVSDAGLRVAVRDIVEIAMPFAAIGAQPGDEVAFFVSLSRDGQNMGHWPHQGYLTTNAPSTDFEEKIWSI